MLTAKQRELLQFITVRLEESGISPSFEEMKEALDLKSKSGVHRLISALEERGFLRRLPNRARALEVLKNPEDVTAKAIKPAKILGGSTITQQLAKNLLLSGERNLLRKGQELVLTLTLEALLSKRRILEIYLNSVEWGEGVFGAEAAAQRYFKKPASKLSAYEAARLAVMLPSPKFFETRPGSAYLSRRTATIVARMGDVSPP